MPKINLDHLSELVKTNPQYTKLFIGLSQIDKFVKQVIKDTIETHADNPDDYYVKTELSEKSYALYLWNAPRRDRASYEWPLELFLNMCKNKTVEFEIQSKVLKIIKGE